MGPTLDSRELISKDTIKMTVIFSITEICVCCGVEGAGEVSEAGIELCLPSAGI